MRGIAGAVERAIRKSAIFLASKAFGILPVQRESTPVLLSFRRMPKIQVARFASNRCCLEQVRG
jgi:hypothetical protein